MAVSRKFHKTVELSALLCMESLSTSYMLFFCARNLTVLSHAQGLASTKQLCTMHAFKMSKQTTRIRLLQLDESSKVTRGHLRKLAKTNVLGTAGSIFSNRVVHRQKWWIGRKLSLQAPVSFKTDSILKMQGWASSWTNPLSRGPS